MKLVNKRWNALLQHPESFAASSSLRLSIRGTSLLDSVVKDESGILFPELTVNISQFFENILPNLKSVTSLCLYVEHDSWIRYYAIL
jgi:hypothetical protein